MTTIIVIFGGEAVSALRLSHDLAVTGGVHVGGAGNVVAADDHSCRRNSSSVVEVEVMIAISTSCYREAVSDVKGNCKEKSGAIGAQRESLRHVGLKTAKGRRGKGRGGRGVGVAGVPAMIILPEIFLGTRRNI